MLDARVQVTLKERNNKSLAGECESGWTRVVRDLCVYIVLFKSVGRPFTAKRRVVNGQGVGVVWLEEGILWTLGFGPQNPIRVTLTNIVCIVHVCMCGGGGIKRSTNTHRSPHTPHIV